MVGDSDENWWFRLPHWRILPARSFRLRWNQISTDLRTKRRSRYNNKKPDTKSLLTSQHINKRSVAVSVSVSFFRPEKMTGVLSFSESPVHVIHSLRLNKSLFAVKQQYRKRLDSLSVSICLFVSWYVCLSLSLYPFYISLPLCLCITGICISLSTFHCTKSLCR